MRLSTRGFARVFAVAAGAALLVLTPQLALAAISHNGQEVSAGDSYTVNESGTCQGHVFSGVSDGGFWPTNGQNITVSGGTHTITLDGLTIDDPGAASSAINIQGGANVTLVLKGENHLEASGNHPGIWVQEGSSLTIEGDGSLVDTPATLLLALARPALAEATTRARSEPSPSTAVPLRRMVGPAVPASAAVTRPAAARRRATSP